MLVNQLAKTTCLARAISSRTTVFRPLSIPTSIRSMATGAATITDRIIHDHQELQRYYHNILNATDVDTKVRWQNQFTWELARHSIGEELVVYPAMEKHLPNGKAMADKDRQEHLQVKELLHKFQGLKPTEGDFEPTLKSLMDILSLHIREEEEHDLPSLEKALHKTDSESMARSFSRTKKFVPTRSHPAAPDKPPFETVAGLMAAPMDRLGDMFRKFPKDDEVVEPRNPGSMA